MRTLIKLYNALSTGTLFLTYAMVEEGRECFTWNIGDKGLGSTAFSRVQWIPPVAYPLNKTLRDEILSGNGSAVLLPRFMDAMTRADTTMTFSDLWTTLSGESFGMLECS